MAERRSIEIEGLSHLAAIPVATKIGPLVVSSVIASFNPGTRDIPDSTDAQIANIYTHVGRILDEVGATWDDVAKMDFWVPSNQARSEVDAGWKIHFPDPASRASRHIHVSGKIVTATVMAYVGD
ncbi:MAG: RidA family protein [Ilumatobacter sp.]